MLLNWLGFVAFSMLGAVIGNWAVLTRQQFTGVANGIIGVSVDSPTCILGTYWIFNGYSRSVTGAFNLRNRSDGGSIRGR